MEILNHYINTKKKKLHKNVRNQILILNTVPQMEQ